MFTTLPRACRPHPRDNSLGTHFYQISPKCSNLFFTEKTIPFHPHGLTVLLTEQHENLAHQQFPNYILTMDGGGGASGSNQGTPGASPLCRTPAKTLSKSPSHSKPPLRSRSHRQSLSSSPASAGAQNSSSAPARELDEPDVLAAGGPMGGHPVREGPGGARVLWPHTVAPGSEYGDTGADGTTVRPRRHPQV